MEVLGHQDRTRNAPHLGSPRLRPRFVLTLPVARPAREPSCVSRASKATSPARSGHPPVWLVATYRRHNHVGLPRGPADEETMRSATLTAAFLLLPVCAMAGPNAPRLATPYGSDMPMLIDAPALSDIPMSRENTPGDFEDAWYYGAEYLRYM